MNDIRPLLELTISAEKTALGWNDPIELNINLKNISRSSKHLIVRSPWLDYDVTIIADDGRALPLSTLAVRSKEAARAGRIMSCELAPNEHLDDYIDLKEWFELAPNCTYKIRATRRVDSADAVRRTLHSNELAVVTAAESEQ